MSEVCSEETNDFSYVLRKMKKGYAARRRNWTKGTFVRFRRNDNSEGNRMTYPYLYVQMKAGGRSPWTPTQADLFCVDWEIESNINE